MITPRMLQDLIRVVPDAQRIEVLISGQPTHVITGFTYNAETEAIWLLVHPAPPPKAEFDLDDHLERFDNYSMSGKRKHLQETHQVKNPSVLQRADRDALVAVHDAIHDEKISAAVMDTERGDV